MTNPEHQALLRIHECVSDYLLGLEIPEFANENGGQEMLLMALRAAYDFYEYEFNTVDDDSELV